MKIYWTLAEIPEAANIPRKELRAIFRRWHWREQWRYWQSWVEIPISFCSIVGAGALSHWLFATEYEYNGRLSPRPDDAEFYLKDAPMVTDNTAFIIGAMIGAFIGGFIIWQIEYRLFRRFKLLREPAEALLKDG